MAIEATAQAKEIQPLCNLKRDQLERALAKTSSAYRASKLLGVVPNTVYNWIEQFGLTREYGKMPVRKLAVKLRQKFHAEPSTQ